MNKHILVISDIEDGDFLSLEKARDIVTDITASLEIIKFTQYTKDLEITLVEHIAKVEQVLDSMIQRVFDNELEITSKVVVSDEIDNWIVDRCQGDKTPIDLVIKGGHRTESLFHTPTDWKLIRHLPCPILIATHTKWKSKANILLTLDLSSEDKKHKQLNTLALEWGNTWATATHTEMHAMYSIPISKPLLELEIVDKDEVLEKKAPAAREKIKALLSLHEMNTVTCHTPAGPPDKTIPRLAGKLNSDLVIMGCLGREGVSGFLLGNTAEKVLHHIRTDCLIIKLPDD